MIPAILFALALVPGLQDEGGVRTPEMDPNRNPVNIAKEFPKINRKADAVLRQLRSFTAAVKQANREEKLSLEGSLKAKLIKGKLWVLMETADHPGGWAQENIAGKKITQLWPAEKTCRRIDYKRNRKAWPIELFYATQYRPSNLAKDYTIKPVQIASEYRKVNRKADDAPGDDPLLKKAKQFENPDGEKQGLRKSGPDPKIYHAVDLVPRSASLRETFTRARLWFHYKTFLLHRVEIHRTVDGAPALSSTLTGYKTGVELDNGEVMIKTTGWKKKSE